MFSVVGEIVTPDGVLNNGSLVVGDDGRIVEIGSTRSVTLQSGDIDASGFWVLPGFVDLHVHGGGGSDFMHGTTDAVRHVARTHARFGTTTLLATTLTASRSETDTAILSIRTVIEEPRSQDTARIAGIHLEGPYLCRARCGAQPQEHIRPPDMNELESWMSLSGSHVRRITIAPELEGAQTLIREAAAAGVGVCMGHTDATAEEAEAALAWGLTGATHVFNAMPPMHHRKPGAAGAALALPGIVVEVIADGFHLHPLMVRLVLHAKGPDGAVLITDAMEGTAMTDGEYALGGRAVIVQNGMASFAGGTLAGSVLTMNRAFLHAKKFAELSLPEASRFASGNAARQLNMDPRFGTLAIGHEADIVMIDPQTGAVEMTIIGGKIAYQR